MNEILLYIYESKAIKDAAKRIAGAARLDEDLISELLIIITETNKDLIERLYKENKLIDYCCKVMYYQFTNDKNEFFKKYRATYQLTQEQKEVEPSDNEETLKQVTEIINRLEIKITQKRYPSEVKLLYLYAELGNYRAVGEEIGIHFTTVRYMVSNIIEKIKKEYDSINYR